MARVQPRVEGVLVTTNFFQTLGVQPVLGRDFTDAEGNENSAIISYSLWQRQFGGDTSVIGRKVNLGTRENQSSTIVGVLPAEMNFPPRIDLFMGSSMDRADTPRGGSHNSRTIARLKPGVTVDQAQSEISALAQRQAAQFPDTNGGWDVSVVPFREYLFGSAQTALPMLLGAVVFVLLIACANVTNLQLGRAVSRRKEIAVRLALGAGRWRIVRQSLIESLLLAIFASGLGLLLAQWALVAFRQLGTDSVPRLTTASLSPAVLEFSVVLTLITGITVGLVPALHASRPDIQAALKDGNNLGTTPRRSNHFRRTLVITQMALTLILLMGAGLLIKSFWKLQAASPGFQPEHVLTVAYRSALVTIPIALDAWCFFSRRWKSSLRYPESIQSVRFRTCLLEDVRCNNRSVSKVTRVLQTRTKQLLTTALSHPPSLRLCECR